RCSMPGKVRMRCASCGKTFKATGSRQTLCNDCMARERAARASARLSGTPTSATPAQATAAPRIVGPGASILVPGAGGTSLPQPPETGSFGSAARNEERARHNQAGVPPHGPAPAAQPARPAPVETAPAARTSREKSAPRVAPQRVVELSDELRARVEARYLELAAPIEFDGIRSRIAAELDLPKSVVKRAILDL